MKNTGVIENDVRGSVCVHVCVRESVCVSEVKDDDPNTTVEMACMW